MKIAIIGAGFTGLSAAYKLSKSKDLQITVFEKEKHPGGLATGFKFKKFIWILEQHYHHIFTSDKYFIKLAKELNYPILFKVTKSSNYHESGISKLDSPLDIFLLKKLGLLEKFRTIFLLGYCKISPFWRPLEKISAEKFIKKYSGERSWQVLWKPLFKNKFGNHYKKVPASWFWARIKKRSKKLGYPKGGFLKFAYAIASAATKNGGKIKYGIKVTKIKPQGEKIILYFNHKNPEVFDKVICTLTDYQFNTLVANFPANYRKNLLRTRGLGAINLVLYLKKPLLKDGTYWLNINEIDYPFLAIVEQTNFINKKYYGGGHVVYIGNYLPYKHKYFRLKAKELFLEFLPYLKKIDPTFTKASIQRMWVFRAPLAQPIVGLNHSKNILPFTTPIQNLYLANMQQVYPWDRGTNYAIHLGEKVASLIELTK